MTEEQVAVVAWMRAILEDRAWTAKEWSELAGVAASSISRAMRDDYASTTSLPVLHRLARAAGVPSPVDFLRGTTSLPTESDLANFLSGFVATNHRIIDPRQLAAALREHFGFRQD